MLLVYASAVNVHCKFVIVVDFHPSRRRRADVCPGINHAGIEPRDSSRVWFRTREEGRESVEQEVKTSDEVRAEGYRGKKAGNTLGSPRQIYAGPGWLAGAPYIHLSLSGPGGRMRTRLTGGEVITLLFPTNLHSPAPAGQRILQDIIRYAPKVDRWLLRSAKTSVPRHRENSLPQDSSLPPCDFSTEKTTPPAFRRRRRRRPNVRNNFRFS